MEKKKAIINPQNNDKECLKWSVIAALEWTEISSHPERVSNLGSSLTITTGLG